MQKYDEDCIQAFENDSRGVSVQADAISRAGGYGRRFDTNNAIHLCGERPGSAHRQ